jgi:hypothetical protein
VCRPEAAGVEVLGQELGEESRGLCGERRGEDDAGRRSEGALRGEGLEKGTRGGARAVSGWGNAWAGLARLDDHAVAGSDCAEEGLEDKGQGEVERPDDEHQPVRFAAHLRIAE